MLTRDKKDSITKSHKSDYLGGSLHWTDSTQKLHGG